MPSTVNASVKAAMDTSVRQSALTQRVTPSDRVTMKEIDEMASAVASTRRIGATVATSVSQPFHLTVQRGHERAHKSGRGQSENGTDRRLAEAADWVEPFRSTSRRVDRGLRPMTDASTSQRRGPLTRTSMPFGAPSKPGSRRCSGVSIQVRVVCGPTVAGLTAAFDDKRV